MHFTAYDTRLAAYAVIIDAQDRILLTWFRGGRDPAGWSLPGGGVELHESLEQAVVREVQEESGYDVVIGAPITTHSVVAPGSGESTRPRKDVRVLFAATITGGSLGTLEVDGSTEIARWTPVEEIATSDEPRADIVDLAIVTWRATQG